MKIYAMPYRPSRFQYWRIHKNQNNQWKEMTRKSCLAAIGTVAQVSTVLFIGPG